MYKTSFIVSLVLSVVNICYAKHDYSIQDVVYSMRKQFTSIESLEMDYTEGYYPEAWKVVSDPSDSKSRFCVCSLKIEGDKYYSETGIDGSYVPEELQGQMAYSIEAFDLQKYQILRKADLTLSVTERSPLIPIYYNPPVLRTFSFLYDGVMGFDTVKNDELWNKLENTAVISETLEMVDKRQCVVLSIMDNNGRLKSKVFCDIDNGYYPIKHECYAGSEYVGSGRMLEETLVSRLNKIKTPEGDIYIPVDVRFTLTTKNGAVGGYYLYKIDTGTLSVNEDIPDEIFTIPRSLARNYEDRDNASNSIFTDFMLKRVLDKLPETDGHEVHNHTSGSNAEISGEILVSENDSRDLPAKTSSTKPNNKWIYLSVCGVAILVGWCFIKKQRAKQVN